MKDEASLYAAAGVDYEPLDRFKRLCQRAAATTAPQLALHGLAEPSGIRGESAYLIETPTGYLAHVEEGLGTKHVVADEMFRLCGRRAYRAIAIDTVATIVNDMITVGALPVSIAMHAGVGDARWFHLAERTEDLAEGFAEGCRLAQAVWGGGETPVLKGVVDPESVVLAGSAVGLISRKDLRIAGDAQPGDRIILLRGTGVHANGITLCRQIATQSPQSYLTPLSDGQTYGDALLAPTPIYVPFVRACQEQGIRLKYAVHITGHGWRKLMRLAEPLVYRVERLFEPQPVFDFVRQSTGMSLREAYATFNMGAGFAVYVAPADADRAVAAARQTGFEALDAGSIEQDGDRKAVELQPHGIVFDGASLQVRS